MGYQVNGEHYISGIRDERLQELQRFIDKTAFPQNRVRSIIRVGHPVEELLKIAVKEQVDMVVMGVKGRTDLEQALVGSVAEKMFRRSPIPVLSYRDEKSAERLLKRIVAE
jgi:nucleotide-binding universal stress UspA family protein